MHVYFLLIQISLFLAIYFIYLFNVLGSSEQDHRPPALLVDHSGALHRLWHVHHRRSGPRVHGRPDGDQHHHQAGRKRENEEK